MSRRIIPFRSIVLLVAIAALLAGGSSAFAAADLRGGWGDWWLPPVRSTHGAAIDSLFNVTFWITMVTFIAVEICLVVFLIKYRHRPDRKKAHFTHGNARLEMAWTLAPAVIFIGLAIANKGVWDRLRFNPDAARPDKATILVIGQQFKWNVIYPGPDGKLGRYLIYPKPTDQRWPGGITFNHTKGPAELKYEEAEQAIRQYIDQENPLGKDMDDPDGKDDDWTKQPGREIVIPEGRPVEVQLSSSDVIHDFFLPNFRVKLDAVPGMRGRIVFTADMTSKQREDLSRRKYTVDELTDLFAKPNPPDLYVSIDKDSPGAIEDAHKKGNYLYVEDPKAKRPRTIIRSTPGFNILTQDNIAKLKQAGITEVTAFESGDWDLVCEELCGQGHGRMKGEIRVLDSEEYNKEYEGGRSLTGPEKHESLTATFTK